MLRKPFTVMNAEIQLEIISSKGTTKSTTKAWNQTQLRGFNQVNLRQKFNQKIFDQKRYIKIKINKTITIKVKTYKLKLDLLIKR